MKIYLNRTPIDWHAMGQGSDEIRFIFIKSKISVCENQLYELKKITFYVVYIMFRRLIVRNELPKIFRLFFVKNVKIKTEKPVFCFESTLFDLKMLSCKKIYEYESNWKRDQRIVLGV